MNPRISVTPLLLSIACLLALLVASCDKPKPGLLDSVPQSAKSVVTVDVDKLLKNAGCQVTNGTYKFTPQLVEAMGQAKAKAVTDWFDCFSKAVDLSDVLIYATETSSTVATAKVTDADALVDALSAYDSQKIDLRDGFDIYALPNGDFALLRQLQVWFAHRADDVINSAKAAETAPFSALSGVTDFLLTDAPLNAAAKLDCLPVDWLADDWLCGSVDFNDNAMNVSVKAMTDDGKTFKFDKYLRSVDTDILSYLPANSQLAAAVGLKADIPWDEAAAVAKSLPGVSFSQKGMIGLTVEQLKKLDGTVAISFAPAAGAPALADFSLSTWDATMLIHLGDDEVDSDIAQLVGSARGFGVDVDEDDGVYCADLSQFDSSLGQLYVSNIDGYFAASTRDFASTDNQLVKTFDDCLGAATIDIPYGSETMKSFRLDYGLNITAHVKDESIQLRARFNGSNSSFLSTLIDLYR